MLKSGDTLDIKQAIRLLLFYFLFSIVIHSVAIAIKKVIGTDYLYFNLVSSALNLVASVIVYVVFFRFIRKNRKIDLKLEWYFKQKSSLVYLVLILASFALFLILSYISTLLPTPPIELKKLFDGNDVLNVFAFTQMVVVIPLLEEVLFRGIILPKFLAYYSKWQAIIYTAILFAIFHLNIWQLPGALLAGIFYDWIYVKFNSLWLTSFLHVLNNLYFFIAVYLSNRMSNILDLTILETLPAFLIGILFFIFSIIVIQKYSHREINSFIN
jgi:uncharacterized protein